MTTRVFIASRLHDGEVFLPATALVVTNGVVEAVEEAVDLDLHLSSRPVRHLPPGSIIAPGYLDLQVNGGGDVMLNDSPDMAGLATIADAHRPLGTTGFLPTLISGSRDQMRAALAVTGAAFAGRMPSILGLHLEGPFLNPARRGIHPADAIRAMEPEDLDLLVGPHPFPLLVTLAPECVPAGAIERLTEAGVIVFAGHSEASAEQAAAAIAAGLAGFTHLYNAMSPLTSRAPGMVGAALAGDAARAGIIVDGVHVHPAAVRAAYAAMGPGRLFLVSDAMSTVGGRTGQFTLGGVTISLSDGSLTGPDDTLGGAHLDMATAVARAVSLAGIPLEHALRMATATPADCLGLTDRGRLRPGCRADFVVLDPALRVTQTWMGGFGIPTGKNVLS